MSADNYPAGSNTSKAPWNQDPQPEREIEVDIEITIRKTTVVKVRDYIINDYGVDEDGDAYEDTDYSECDIVGAVADQVSMPGGVDIKECICNRKQSMNDCDKWRIEEFIVRTI